jgi:multicomponent Na+:H+ antiporter subunit C
MEHLFDLIVANANYWSYIILMMIGIYAMISKNNLIKKIIGMSIFQTAIILFYVSTAYKKGASIPIIAHGNGHEEAVHAASYINPLPHVLMLTAIVVGVATLGVALALAMKVYKQYETVEEDEINNKIRIEAGQ